MNKERVIKIKINGPMPEKLKEVMRQKTDRSHHTILEYHTGKLTPLESRIVSDPEFSAGLHYGKPRKGHPEGEVIYHIQEVLRNVEYFSTPETREKLRLVALIHDTFKYKVVRTQPKIGENHHGRIARNFAEKYISDESILQVIEMHDDAYNCYRYGDNNNRWEAAKDKAFALIKTLGENVDLYLQFYECDIKTGNKDIRPLRWFEVMTKSYRAHAAQKSSS